MLYRLETAAGLAKSDTFSTNNAAPCSAAEDLARAGVPLNTVSEPRARCVRDRLRSAESGGALNSTSRRWRTPRIRLSHPGHSAGFRKGQPAV